ncbi:unnamed protein product [Lymnaea stagnalis]|uniref:RRP15-like protein n=1 Tax=Lymnaea stagnalis TaxID=6523 RepID=A0AAV2I2U9_LYMST
MAAVSMVKGASDTEKENLEKVDDDQETDSDSEDIEDRISDSGSEADSENEETEQIGQKDGEKSGMAGVIARILSKDISKSNRVLLAKGKTNKEILKDISERKLAKEETQEDDSQPKNKETKINAKKSEFFKEEKRKIWESMGRKTPSVLDNPKEMRLRKIATQGMVQLFRSVNEHQKLLKEKLASVGPSERKKDQVISEFTKGKFLDLLKGKKENQKPTQKDTTSKWNILQDDYMMGATMKDWDKEGSDSGDDNDESMQVDDNLSDDE